MWLVNNAGPVVSDIPFGAFSGPFNVVVVHKETKPWIKYIYEKWNVTEGGGGVGLTAIENGLEMALHAVFVNGLNTSQNI